jgi:hypothetical protein
VVKFFEKVQLKELHEFCVSHNYAPHLLAVEELPGGWVGIAMKYLPLAIPVDESPSLIKHICARSSLFFLLPLNHTTSVIFPPPTCQIVLELLLVLFLGIASACLNAPLSRRSRSPGNVRERQLTVLLCLPFSL